MAKEPKIFRIRCDDESKLDSELRELYEQGWRIVGVGNTGTSFDTSQVLLVFLERETSDPPNKKTLPLASFGDDEPSIQAVRNHKPPTVPGNPEESPAQGKEKKRCLT